MTAPEEWSPEALALLDSLWGLHTSMLVIRRRLHPLLGFFPMPDQIAAMVNRPREPVEIIAPRPVFETIATDRIERFGFAPPMRADNVVRRVEPKTFPANKFTMLGEKR